MSSYIRRSRFALVLGMGAAFTGSTAVLPAQTITTKPKPVAPKAVVKPAVKPTVKPAPAVAIKPAVATPSKTVATAPASAVAKTAAVSSATQPAVVQPAVVTPAVMQPSPSAGAASYQPAVQQYQSSGSPASAGGVSSAQPNPGTLAGQMSGIGTFKYGDVTVLAVNCMRSGTRVFCDYDESRQNVGNLNAGWVFNRIGLVLSGGRIVNVSNAFFVDDQGNTFQTASVGPTSPVRMMLEYDNVPASYTSAALTYGQTQYPNVAIQDVGALPANGTMPARSSQATASGQAAAGQVPGAAGSALTTAQNAATNAQNGITNAQNTVSNAQTSVSNTANTVNTSVSKAKGWLKGLGTAH